MSVPLGMIVNEDGTYRCPTEKCNAMCCRNGDPFAENEEDKFRKGIVCRFLDETDNMCSLQKLGGIHYKPFACAMLPDRQWHVDLMNDMHASGEQKCYLSFQSTEKIS